MNNYNEVKAKVLRVDEEEHKFIIEVEDRIYKVAQIAFQRRQPMPEYLDCLMITTHLGKVFIIQNIERLMRKQYKENDEVNFKIKLTLGEYYQLEDEFGFTAMLKRDTNINAALTPMVRCRVMKFRQRYMDVMLVVPTSRSSRSRQRNSVPSSGSKNGTTMSSDTSCWATPPRMPSTWSATAG